jgi:signal transduction histidine kinase
VNIDKRLFLHAAGNIIDNAIKYSDPYTKIIIWCEQKGNRILINIENEGISLLEKDAEWIFERGTRTEDAKKRVPSGTGLGLWLAKIIMKIHRGDVWATPTDPQGKAKFVMQLPLNW